MSIVFGLSKNFAWAIGTRLSQGILGAVVVTSKAIIFTTCDETNNRIAMAAMIGSYSTGMVVGPALGGYLVYPCRSPLNMCPQGSLLDTYPFLLPNLICSIGLSISIILTYFYIPLIKKDSGTEETALLNDQLQNHSQQDGSKGRRSNIVAVYDSIVLGESFALLSIKSTQTPTNIERDKQLGKISYFHIDESSYIETDGICMACWKSFKKTSFFQLIRLKKVLLSLILYANISFVAIGFDEIYPVYADSLHRYGGLQFTSIEIGRSLLLSAIPLVILTVTYPRISQKIGNVKMIIYTYYVLIFGLPLFPLISALGKRTIWGVVVISMLTIQYTMCGNFFSVSLLMNNSAPQKFIGAVNGLGMTMSCLFRLSCFSRHGQKSIHCILTGGVYLLEASCFILWQWNGDKGEHGSCFRMMSPATLGPLYTWSLGNEGRIGFPFNHCFSFVVLALVCFVSLFFAICVPKEEVEMFDMNSKAEERRPSLPQNTFEEKILA